MFENIKKLMTNSEIQANEQLPEAQINSTSTSNRIDVGIQKQTHIT